MRDSIRYAAIAACVTVIVALALTSSVASGASISVVDCPSFVGAEGTVTLQWTNRWRGWLTHCDVHWRAGLTGRVYRAEAQLGGRCFASFKAPPSGRIYFVAHAVVDGKSYFSTIKTIRVVQQDRYESDDDPLTAQSIASGQTQNRTIHSRGNVDWVRFDLPRISDILIEARGRGDTQMWLYGPDTSEVLRAGSASNARRKLSRIDLTGTRALGPVGFPLFTVLRFLAIESLPML